MGRRADPASLREAHRRAAQYWRWRVKALPQSRQQDIEDWLEARYHCHQAGEIDTAVEVTEMICDQLDTWGVWQPEEQLCRETLSWLPERSSKSADFLHQLGNVAYQRGDYDQALEWYRKSLAINEELGNRAGMATSYHQLGILLTEQGMAEQGVPFTLQSLYIFLELKLPQARTALNWLRRQRETLGEEDLWNETKSGIVIVLFPGSATLHPGYLLLLH